MADSGYGNEENYAYCENENVQAFVKYNTFDKEQTKAWQKQIGRVENMTYDDELDEWICANNKRLIFAYESKRKTDNGYVTLKRTYRCFECANCPFQDTCIKAKEVKSISVSVENPKAKERST